MAINAAPLRDRVVAYFTEQAIPDLDAMLQSFEGVRNSLCSHDSRVREAALWIASEYWERIREVAPVCEKLILEDPDFNIRLAALCVLSNGYRGSYDFRTGEFLTSLVRDIAQPPELRSAAYKSLCDIRGIVPRPYLNFQFPGDVDWTFVDSFSEMKEPPSELQRLRDQCPSLDENECRAIISAKKADQALKNADFEEVIRQLTECIRHVPGAGAYLMRGEAYLALGKWDEAILDFTRSLEISPGSAKAHLGRSSAYKAKGLLDEARRDYQLASFRDRALDETRPVRPDNARIIESCLRSWLRPRGLPAAARRIPAASAGRERMWAPPAESLAVSGLPWILQPESLAFALEP
jgi:tetratricopeptide (TPR) repeat protein